MPQRRYDATNIDSVQFHNNTFYLIKKHCTSAIPDSNQGYLLCSRYRPTFCTVTHGRLYSLR